MARCAGYKRNGEGCTATVEPPKTRCWWHSPENAEKRIKAASRGGKSKSTRVVRDLHALLENLTEQVIAGDLEPYRAGVAGQLVGVRLRLLEFERRVKEQDELVGRLEELEEQAADAKSVEGRRLWNG